MPIPDTDGDSPWGRLAGYLSVTEDLRGISEQLYWDSTTYLPAGSASYRGRQSAVIERRIIERTGSDELERLLDDLPEAGCDETADLVRRVCRRDLEMARRRAPDLLAEYAELSARAMPVWRAARQASDFGAFAGMLQSLVDLNRRIADHMGYADHPLDALMSAYEPGPSVATISSLVDQLAGPLRMAARRCPSPAASEPVGEGLRPDEMIALVEDIGALVGFDRDRGMVAASSHPATSSGGPEDVRITVRTDVPLPEVISSAVHEFGHALYDQGSDRRWWGTPVARGAMPYVHESQSKFWENHVLRVPEFAGAVARVVVRRTGRSVEPDRLRQAWAGRGLSPIRINSNEIGFMLHIVIRWEIETRLLDGSARAADLPRLWNELTEHYLGLVPANDAQGCLQDPHWCHRFMGLFPGYLVGSVAAAQLWQACLGSGVDVAAALERDDLSPVLAWLRQAVHHAGRAYSIDEVVRRAGFPGLTAGPYLTEVVDRV
jgi:carboxypeptidase Taq